MYTIYSVQDSSHFDDVFSEESRGRKPVWPFTKMAVGQVVILEEKHLFDKARCAINAAKRNKGYLIVTKLIDGKLYVKRTA